MDMSSLVHWQATQIERLHAPQHTLGTDLFLSESNHGPWRDFKLGVNEWSRVTGADTVELSHSWYTSDKDGHLQHPSHTAAYSTAMLRRKVGSILLNYCQRSWHRKAACTGRARALPAL